MVGEGDGLVVEVRGRVAGCVAAVGDRDRAEGVRGQPVGVQIALGGHGDPGGRGEQAEGEVPAERRALGGGLALLDAGAEAAAGALVERAVADDDFGDPGGDRQRRLLDGRAGRAAPVVDPREEGQLADAGRLGDGDLGVGVHGEGDQAVDVRGGQPGVVQGGTYRLDGERQFAAAGVLGELGRADSGDGGPAAEGIGAVDAHAVPSGRPTVTVPVTWWPRPFAPTTRTTAVPSVTSVTVPLNTIVSPG